MKTLLRKTRKKRFISLALALCMLLILLVGCGGNDSTDRPSSAVGSPTGSSETTGNSSSETSSSADTNSNSTEKTKIVVGLAMDGGNLGPWTSVTFGNVNIKLNLFERLCTLDDDGSSEFILLKDVRQIDDITYHLEIYDYIYDHAGNHLTASDVVFSINTFVEAGNKGAVATLDTLSVVSDYVVEWKCTTPFAPGAMFSEISRPSIATEAAYRASPDQFNVTPIGTGPYKLTSYIPGSSITVEKFEDYWQTDESLAAWHAPQNVDIIEYKIILDSSQMAMALESGEIDIAGELNQADLIAFQDSSKYNLIEVPQQAPLIVTFNSAEQSVCSDINLRRAILTGIDNDGIVAAAPFKFKTVTSISSPTQADYVAEWADRTIWNYDASAAKGFLDQSDYKGETLTLMIIGGARQTAVAVIVQAQLAELGINVQIETVETATWWVTAPDPTAYDFTVYATGGGAWCAQCWTNNFNYDIGRIAYYDPILQEKFEAAMMIGGEANLVAFQDYVDEMAYAKGLVMPFNETASNKKVVEPNTKIYGKAFYIPSSIFIWN